MTLTNTAVRRKFVQPKTIWFDLSIFMFIHVSEHSDISEKSVVPGLETNIRHSKLLLLTSLIY